MWKPYVTIFLWSDYPADRKLAITPRHARLPEGCATTAENPDTSLPTAPSPELPMASSVTHVEELVSHSLIRCGRRLMRRTCQVWLSYCQKHGWTWWIRSCSRTKVLPVRSIRWVQFSISHRPVWSLAPMSTR